LRFIRLYDPSLTSLTLLRSRFGPEDGEEGAPGLEGEPEAAALAGALASTRSPRELNLPSHPPPPRRLHSPPLCARSPSRA